MDKKPKYITAYHSLFLFMVYFDTKKDNLIRRRKVQCFYLEIKLKFNKKWFGISTNNIFYVNVKKYL